MRHTRCLAALGLVLAVAGCTSQGSPTAATTTATSTAAGPTGTGTPGTGTASTPPPTSPGGGGGTGGTGTEAPPPAPGGPARCSAAVLQGTVQPKDAAAGNRYAELVVTNTGSAPCTLYGYGGLQLVDAGGQPLPTTTLRDERPGPALVTVQPGGHAAKLLHWGVVATGNEPVNGPCQPAAAKLAIIPPDETQQFSVPWDLGPVCAAGTIHGSAYYPR